MADLQHTYGSDLTVSATGSLALSDGVQLGQERVLRRLLTAPGAYIWQLEYGAGLPAFIGTPAPPEQIAAVTRAQMFLEAAVARSPAPTITVVGEPNGYMTVTVQYTDAETQSQVPLNVPLSG